MKRRVFCILLVLLLGLLGVAQAAPSPAVTGAYRVGPFHDSLAIFCTMGDFRYGLVDPQGQVKVSPQWDDAQWLTDSLITVFTYDSGWYGVVDRSGAYVSNTQWDRVTRADGCTLLWKGGLFAILSDAGKQITEPLYAQFVGLSEGIALLTDADGKYAYVDVAAGAIDAQRWADARLFAGGFAAVDTGAGWNFINSKGEPLLKEGCQRISDFAGGQAVCVANNAVTSLIDTSGTILMIHTDYAADNVTLQPYFDEVLGAYGYRDAAGKTVITPRFREAEPFYSALAKVKYREGWGFIDAKGSLVLANSWSLAEHFVGRYAYVQDTLYQGYIDPSGRVFSAYPVLAKTLEDPALLVMDIGGKQHLADAAMQPFTRTGYGRIKDGGEGTLAVADSYLNDTAATVWGLIDKKGATVLLPVWNSIDAFKGGVARVSLNGKYGLIDTTGKVLTAPTYDAIDASAQGRYLAFTGATNPDGANLKGKYTFLRADGTVLAKGGWDYAEPFAGGLALVYTGTVDPLTGKPLVGKYGYIDLEGVVAFAPTWQQANSFAGGAAAVLLDGQWNIIDTKGATLFQ